MVMNLSGVYLVVVRGGCSCNDNYSRVVSCLPLPASSSISLEKELQFN